MRVVSLVPSLTETLVRWGLPPVACTRFCEQPEIRHVGGTKNPDIAAIVGLAPDLVVMCEEENRREDAQALGDAGVVTAAVSIECLEDVPPALEMVAGLVTGDSAAEEGGARRSGTTSPARGFREAVDSALRATGSRRSSSALRAFIPIWKRPWITMSATTYGSSLLAALGVGNVFADVEERYPETTLEEAAARQPDVVLAPSEPYPFAERHAPLLREVAPVVLVDGQDLFWWGVRTPEAIARLSDALSDIVA